jgi:hypothetical protein
LPISAVDVIGPAFEHTKQQLFRPFGIAQWAKLAFVGLLAGEMSSGGCSSPNFNRPSRGAVVPHLPGQLLHMQNPMLYAGLIAVLVVAALFLFILFLYISSVMRFVLFDSVVAKRCEIGRSWNHRQGAGVRYFVWKLLFTFVTAAVLVILIGIPAAFAFASGWFRHPKQHVAELIFGGILLFFIVLAWFFLSLAVQVLTKDFVIPQMALENLGPLQAWRRLLPMIDAEKGGYAGYLGMKLVLNIAAAIMIGIISLIAILLLLIPAGGIGVIAVLIGKTAGLTFNLYTISLTVIFAFIFIAIVVYVIALISVPAIVFFPAYSIHFFAARYRPLSEFLYPVPLPPIIPTSEPPLMPPLPEPGV